LLTVKPEFKIDTTQLLDIIEGQSQILNISVTGYPNDIAYTLYNNGVESTSSNIYVNNSVLIFKLSLWQFMWDFAQWYNRLYIQFH
jgi:hypothetical protein